MQALILAGGEGRRLRPLTVTVPKPIVPLVDRPFIAHMIGWLRRHGVEEVILACGFMAGALRRALGDGRALGVRLRYVEEPRPLGTAGALKYAERLLDERFVMLNGDVLTDLDLGAQLAQHERTRARATLALVAVEDPAAYGLVRLSAGGAVREFVEKPLPGRGGGGLVNAGVYVLERELLAELAPAGTASSIERDVFPRLVGRGLFGHPASGYWLDIGTPERYLQATFDILSGTVTTSLIERLRGGVLVEDGWAGGTVRPPALVRAGCELAATATVGGHAVVGPAVSIGPRALVERSVVLAGASVGADSTVRCAIIGPRARVGERCTVEGGVLGERAVLAPGGSLGADARIFPGVVVPAGALQR